MTRSTSRSRPARSAASSGRTAPGNRPSSTSSPGSRSRAQARSASRAEALRGFRRMRSRGSASSAPSRWRASSATSPSSTICWRRISPDPAGPRRARQRLAKAWGFLELTRLARLAHHPAKTLSGGQRVLLQAMAGFMVPSLALLLARRALRRREPADQGSAHGPHRGGEPRAGPHLRDRQPRDGGDAPPMRARSRC